MCAKTLNNRFPAVMNLSPKTLFYTSWLSSKKKPFPTTGSIGHCTTPIIGRSRYGWRFLKEDQDWVLHLQARCCDAPVIGNMRMFSPSLQMSGVVRMFNIPNQKEMSRVYAHSHCALFEDRRVCYRFQLLKVPSSVVNRPTGSLSIDMNFIFY